MLFFYIVLDSKQITPLIGSTYMCSRLETNPIYLAWALDKVFAIKGRWNVTSDRFCKIAWY